jgi:adenylate cyclase
VARLSAEEVAELVPCSVEQVRRLEELGILGPHLEDGLFEAAAVHVVRLMDAFEESGVSLDDIGRGMAEGELSFPLGLFLPEPAPMSATYESLGAQLERSPELLRRLSRELGLPPLPGDRIRDEDAQLLSQIVTKLDLAEDEELSRFARLYGGSIQRLVSSGLQWFDRTVNERVGTWGLPDAERDALVYRKGAAFAELVAGLVPWLQRRHREHAVLDYLVSVTEVHMEERGMIPSAPKQQPAIAFLDLTGYTALAEEHGDEAAAELAAGLAGVVNQAAREYGGRPVKWLGDGVMFHFTDPARAVVGGLELIEQTESAVSVPARMGINAGAVVAQEGDYFGRTVNVAARIADYARPHEVLVSEEARRSADAADVRFELIGDVPLKGVSRSVRLHRVTRRAHA